MKIFTYIIIVIFSSLIFSHEYAIYKSNKMVEVETKDGNILLGYIIDSDDNGFTLETKDGLKIMIPKSSVLRSSTLENKDKDGRIFRAQIQTKVFTYLLRRLSQLKIRNLTVEIFVFSFHLITEDLVIIFHYSLVLL